MGVAHKRTNYDTITIDNEKGVALHKPADVELWTDKWVWLYICLQKEVDVAHKKTIVYYYSYQELIIVQRRVSNTTQGLYK